MSKKHVVTVLFVMWAIVLQSCNNSLTDAIVVKNDAQNLSYNLTENGCSTGQQEYDSLTSLCDGLKNESRNNFCAYNLRRAKYESDCFSLGPWPN